MCSKLDDKKKKIVLLWWSVCVVYSVYVCVDR